MSGGQARITNASPVQSPLACDDLYRSRAVSAGSLAVIGAGVRFGRFLEIVSQRGNAVLGLKCAGATLMREEGAAPESTSLSMDQ